MTTLLLYAATVLVWGSTWIMMKFQLGVVAPAASLTYRYFLAGCLVLIGARLAGKVIRLGWRQHLWCALQGSLMFSVNYWLTYLAAAHLTTGVVSVFFAGVSGATMLIGLILFRKVPDRLPAIGAALGVCGTALVFWPEVSGLPLDGPEVTSGLLLILSVFMFASGGLIGARNLGSGMPRYATIGWAMCYGGIWMACVTLIRGESFDFELTATYVGSLLWLTVMGSGVVFVMYFIVVERIGPERAAYASVMFPLVALIISTFAEDYHWPLAALVGVPLAIAGNGLVLWQGRTPRVVEPHSPPPGRRAPREPEPVEWPVNVVKLPQDGGGVTGDQPKRALRHRTGNRAGITTLSAAVVPRAA